MYVAEWVHLHSTIISFDSFTKNHSWFCLSGPAIASTVFLKKLHKQHACLFEALPKGIHERYIDHEGYFCGLPVVGRPEGPPAVSFSGGIG